MRNILINIGKFIKARLGFQSLLTIYGIAGGGYVIVNFYIGATHTPRTPFQLAKEVVISFIWLLLFFVLTYLLIQAISRFLIWAGNYYPNWFYFPKIVMSASILPNNDIELKITNRMKRKSITLRAIYGLVQSPDVKIGVSGVAPDSVKELLPSDEMEENSSRKVIIGKVTKNKLILSRGKKSNEDNEFSSPGLYHYYVNVKGKYKGRDYSGSSPISIRILDDNTIIIDEEGK